MKNFIKKAWEAFVSLVCRVSYDHLLYFTTGLLIGCFFSVALGMEAPIVPVGFAVFIKAMFDMWLKDGGWEWMKYGPALLGGALVQLFAFLHIWWF